MKPNTFAASVLLGVTLLAGSAFGYQIEKPECIAPANPAAALILPAALPRPV